VQRKNSSKSSSRVELNKRKKRARENKLSAGLAYQQRPRKSPLSLLTLLSSNENNSQGTRLGPWVLSSCVYQVRVRQTVQLWFCLSLWRAGEQPQHPNIGNAFFILAS
jgi:hypothetical protein